MNTNTSTDNRTADLGQHLPSFSRLQQHQQQWQSSLVELFANDPERAEKMTLEMGPLLLDYSKSHLNQDTLSLLCELADEAGLNQAIKDLLNGESVNNTEDRPAWHTLLRADSNLSSEGADVEQTQQKMASFVDRVHNGNWQGYAGDTVTDIVNIGIGGSDLGPRMVCKALCDFHQKPVNVHFVANIDGAEIFHTLRNLNPKTTLFIIASKSFTTLETLENATTARQWMLDAGCTEDQLQHHFVAISTNLAKATAFGIGSDNIFPMWDWVGGRYSLWSAIGLPIALAVGWENFQQLLAGARAMDNHFAEAPFEANMPVILALLTFWYSQCWGAQSQAVLPYCHQLQRLPDYMQQLDMESLGKSVNREGIPVDYPTGIAIWGTEESNGQHSFHQLFHQGTALIPVDFIATLQPNHPHEGQHRQLLGCCLSQSQAMLAGKTLEQAEQELRNEGRSENDVKRLASHKVIPGNRPSNTLLLQRLTPNSLGSLIALYEHKVYALSVLLNINAYDQWGVELGKQLGVQIDKALVSGQLPDSWDSSTRRLAERILGR